MEEPRQKSEAIAKNFVIAVCIILAFIFVYYLGRYDSARMILSSAQEKKYTSLKAANELLDVANKISDSDIREKDKVAELVEVLSHTVRQADKTGTICDGGGSDSECEKFEQLLEAVK